MENFSILNIPNLILRFRLAQFLFLIASSTLPYTASFASTALTPSEEQKVQNGEIVIKTLNKKNNGRHFQGHAIFPYNIETIIRELSNYENYPSYMPDVSKTEIIASNPTIVNYTLTLPLGIKRYYRLEHHLRVNRQLATLSWQQVTWPEIKPEDSIVDTRGFWQLTALANGATHIIYDIYTNPGPIPIGLGWIVDYLTKQSVPAVLENTKSYLHKTQTSN